jgi:hypothetical protein
MENDTIAFTTKGGVAVVLRTFITGRQKRYITDAFLEDVQLTQAGDKQNFSVAASKANVATDRALESLIVSVNGKTDNVVAAVLDLPAADSDEIIAKVNEITADKKKDETTPKT